MQLPPVFFPDPYFGWTFYAVLVAFTLVGAYLDLQKAILPKWLTLSLLAVGICFNILRGAWLGQLDGTLWMGALNGLWFSAVGFFLTTVLFFLFWAFKLCGGGDVKLFAALGAWVGFWHALFIMLASTPVMLLLLVLRLMSGGLKPMAVQKRLRESQVIQGGLGKGKARMTYAFPVAVAVIVVLLWTYRVDLGLAARKADSQTTQAVKHND